MKRTIWNYLLMFCVMFFCFSVMYYFSYSQLKSMLDRRESESEDSLLQNGSETDDLQNDRKETDPSEDETDRLIFNEGADGSEEDVSDSDEEESTADGFLAADADGKLKTNSSMVYVIGQYDWTTGVITETVERFPEELLGLTRQELLVFLRENPEYGTLLSFSEHAVYLRKNVDTDWSEYLYFLVLEEDELMVYHGDQTAIYLETGILAEELSAENRELLEDGFYVKDAADLFDYLQTVTS